MDKQQELERLVQDAISCGVTEDRIIEILLNRIDGDLIQVCINDIESEEEMGNEEI